jgi:hypothetical protein
MNRDGSRLSFMTDIGVGDLGPAQRAELERTLLDANVHAPILLRPNPDDPNILDAFVVTGGNSSAIKVGEAIPMAKWSMKASPVVDTQAAPRDSDVATDVRRMGPATAVPPVAGQDSRTWLSSAVNDGLLETVARLKAQRHEIFGNPGTKSADGDAQAMAATMGRVRAGVCQAAGMDLFRTDIGGAAGAADASAAGKILKDASPGDKLEVLTEKGVTRCGVVFQDLDDKFKVLEYSGGNPHVCEIEEFVRAQSADGNKVVVRSLENQVDGIRLGLMDRNLAEEARMRREMLPATTERPINLEDHPQGQQAAAL